MRNVAPVVQTVKDIRAAMHIECRTRAQQGTELAITAAMKRRYLCRACKCDDFEAIVDHLGGDGATVDEAFACFTCQELFYFMPDARPRPWALGMFEVYGSASPKKVSRR